MKTYRAFIIFSPKPGQPFTAETKGDVVFTAENDLEATANAQGFAETMHRKFPATYGLPEYISVDEIVIGPLNPDAECWPSENRRMVWDWLRPLY